MFEKLVPDASHTKVSYDGGILSSAEHVVIPPGEVRTVSTGLVCEHNLALLLDKFSEVDLSMCVLLTSVAPRFREIKVSILNRGSDPVTIPVKCSVLEFFEI